MNIKEIAKYIIENYPDSCLAHNLHGILDYYYEKLLYEECLNFFLYEKLGICGCGSPWVTANVIKDLLNILYKYETARNRDWQEAYDDKMSSIKSLCGVVIENNNNYDGLVQFMMYMLDDKGFLEHGTGIGGAWLTNEGKMFLHVLNNCNS